jgi:hypothetical protein
MRKIEWRNCWDTNETAAAQIEQQSLALQNPVTTAYQTYLTNLELID